MNNQRQIIIGIAAMLTLVLIDNEPCKAQEDGVWIDLLRFQNENAPYFEIQLEFQSNALTAQKADSGWQTTAQFEATLESADGIVNYVKTLIAGPVELDSLAATTGTQLHIERMEAPPGNYRINMMLNDAVGTFSSASSWDFKVSQIGRAHV